MRTEDREEVRLLSEALEQSLVWVGVCEARVREAQDAAYEAGRVANAALSRLREMQRDAAADEAAWAKALHEVPF